MRDRSLRTQYRAFRRGGITRPGGVIWSRKVLKLLEGRYEANGKAARCLLRTFVHEECLHND